MDNVNTQDDYKKCVCCNRFYKAIASNGACINCNDTGRYDYMRVREYLKSNYGKAVSVVKISVDLNIKLGRIFKLIETGCFNVVEKQGDNCILSMEDFKGSFDEFKNL